MKVEIMRAFARYSVGQIIPEMPANQAGKLIARGMVRQIEAPVNRMMRPAKTEKYERKRAN